MEKDGQIVEHLKNAIGNRFVELSINCLEGTRSSSEGPFCMRSCLMFFDALGRGTNDFQNSPLDELYNCRLGVASPYSSEEILAIFEGITARRLSAHLHFSQDDIL